MTSLVSPCVFEAESRFVLDCSRAGREKNVFGAEASDETRFFSVRTLKRVTKKFATIYSGFSSISIPFFLFFAARLKSELLRITFWVARTEFLVFSIFFVIFFFQFIHSMKRTSPTWLLCLALALNGKRGRARGRGEINLMNRVEPVWYGRKSNRHENCFICQLFDLKVYFQSDDSTTLLNEQKNESWLN